jgi:hypothetical protein
MQFARVKNRKTGKYCSKKARPSGRAFSSKQAALICNQMSSHAAGIPRRSYYA